MEKWFFLLGVSDPEMRMIEKIIREAGMPFAYATAGGKSCHPGNVYRADPVMVPPAHQLVVIECEPTNIGDYSGVVHIDHHRPQDAGFHKGPRDYLMASSLGQLCKLIGVTPTQAVMNMAAMDHCFPAAVGGRCPEVSPGEVISLKVAEIATATRVGSKEVYDRIVDFQKALRKAPKEEMGGMDVVDLRENYLGEGYSLSLLAAQVAVVLEGQTALLRSHDRAGEAEKITLSGNVTPETVKAFLETWAPAHGLVRTYGVPARGYAGGYVV